MERQKIRALCIDIDQTLLDFDACANWCIRQGFQDWTLPCSPEVYPTFKKINDQLWLAQERQELDHETFLQIRWNTIFKKLGMEDQDGPAFEVLFHDYLSKSHIPVDGALEAVKELAESYPLYIVSNGPSGQQERRLKEAGMLGYFKGVFTSEEFGVKKPNPRFFEKAYDIMKKDLPGLKPDEILLIGDSWTADIQGALKAGWQALWFKGKHEDVCQIAYDWNDVVAKLCS